MIKQLKYPRVSKYFGQSLSINDFEKMRKLGKGSFGKVILFRHKATKKQYAIKAIQLSRLIKQEKIDPQQLQSMIRKEIQILYKIDNQNIIKLLDHFETENSVYLITQYIEGTNLFELTMKNDAIKLAENEIADIIYQICSGLQELHINHIIHRDLKLENLMYNKKCIKIVDLGCSNFYGGSIQRKTKIGTQFYYSPEIILQEQQNDRLDVWCVGVVLYQLLFLAQPFSEPDFEKKIRKIQYSFPKDQKIEPELEDLFKKIFRFKDKRISAHHLKIHPWIKKHRINKESRMPKFQDFFDQYEVENYRQLLEQNNKINTTFLEQFKHQTNFIQNMLKQAKRELRYKK